MSSPTCQLFASSFAPHPQMESSATFELASVPDLLVAGHRPAERALRPRWLARGQSGGFKHFLRTGSQNKVCSARNLTARSRSSNRDHGACQGGWLLCLLRSGVLRPGLNARAFCFLTSRSEFSAFAPYLFRHATRLPCRNTGLFYSQTVAWPVRIVEVKPARQYLGKIVSCED